MARYLTHELAIIMSQFLSKMWPHALTVYRIMVLKALMREAINEDVIY
jgi:hypothetical protein